jgi:hypothetical protein
VGWGGVCVSGKGGGGAGRGREGGRESTWIFMLHTNLFRTNLLADLHPAALGWSAAGA